MSAERSVFVRRFLALGLGVFTAALSWFSKNNFEIPPELWDDIAVAAKLRPPMYEFPLLWRILVSKAVELLGLADCLYVLKIAGACSLGLLSTLTFIFYSGFCSDGDRAHRMAMRLKKGRLAFFFILCASVLIFVCSEPVWQAGRIFSPAIFAMLLTVSALIFSQRAISECSYYSLLMLGAVSGILASETPLGFLPVVFCGLSFKFRNWNLLSVDKLNAQASSIVMTVGVRRMSLCFMVSWVLTMALNLSFYRAYCGCLEENDNLFMGVVGYLLNYLEVIQRSISPLGFILMMLFVIAPLIIIAVSKKELCNLRKLLPVRHITFLLIMGFLAFLQSTGFKSCHFWRLIEGAISSEYLLCVGVLSTSLCVFLCMYIFTVDVYFRNYIRVLKGPYSKTVLGESALFQRIMLSYRVFVKILRPLISVFPFLAVLFVIVFKFDATHREMSSIVNAVARQSAEESLGAQMLITDGSFDAGVEIAAAVRGENLKTLSIMSKNSQYDIALRLRGVTNEIDRALLEAGTAEALRTWVKEKNPCASNIALQVGMELWRNDISFMPKAGGLVMRTAGFAPQEASRAADCARGLAERILNLCETSEIFRFKDDKLNRLLMFAQWRLSRMCRMRANEAERENNFAASEKENDLADRLDQANPEWRRVQERMDWVTRQERVRLTPQEGLKIGLERADFKLASVYARQILKYKPDDLKANFAMGMGLFIDEQYGRAEKHLRQCLTKAPDEPAVLNNLAIALLRLGRYAEAETNAVKALKILPNSSEIKTTLRHIRKKMEE